MADVQLANGYKMTTTFVDDFVIAAAFGKNAIKDTYRRAIKGWKNNYIYMTELEVALGILACHYSKHGRNDLVETFSDLFYKCQDVFYETYGSDSEEDKKARDFHFKVTD